MKRNRDKYPHLPSEFTDKQIELAVENWGSIKEAASRLGVSYLTLHGAMNRRGIFIQRGVGGNKSRFDRAPLIKLTAENRAKAAATMDRINARNEFAKMIRHEKNIHAAAVGAARTRIRAKFAEGIAR